MLYSTTPEDAESDLRYSHHPVECHEDGEVEVAPVSVASTVSRCVVDYGFDRSITAPMACS
jgi:hypothetical protein